MSNIYIQLSIQFFIPLLDLYIHIIEYILTINNVLDFLNNYKLYLYVVKPLDYRIKLNRFTSLPEKI